MPGTARKKGESGYYHVILRGIGGQILFEDDEDNERFLSAVQRTRLELIGGPERFGQFMEKASKGNCLDIHERAGIRDEAAGEWICSHYKIASGTQRQQWDKKKRDAALRELKDMGMSVRQLERLTGINRGVVQKA